MHRAGFRVRCVRRSIGLYTSETQMGARRCAKSPQFLEIAATGGSREGYDEQHAHTHRDSGRPIRRIQPYWKIQTKHDSWCVQTHPAELMPARKKTGPHDWRPVGPAPGVSLIRTLGRVSRSNPGDPNTHPPSSPCPAPRSERIAAALPWPPGRRAERSKKPAWVDWQLLERRSDLAPRGRRRSPNSPGTPGSASPVAGRKAIDWR